MLNTDTKAMTIENVAIFNSEYQPSLPKDFPRDRIPAEKCGHALAQMLLCQMNSQSNLCAKENKHYYVCRRERDA